MKAVPVSRTDFKLKNLILIFSLFIISCFSGSSDISWKTGSFEDIQVTALKDKKNILIYITADWCGYCRYMDDNVLTDPAIKKYISSKFLPYMVKDKSPEIKFISRIYRTTSFPYFIILKPDGTEILRIRGKKKKDDFLNSLKIAHTGKYTLEYYLEKLNKHPEDPEIMTRIFLQYSAKKDCGNAFRYLRRIETAAPDYYNPRKNWFASKLAEAE